MYVIGGQDKVIEGLLCDRMEESDQDAVQIQKSLYELSWEKKTKIHNLTKMYVPCEGCEIPHVFYFILPSSEQIEQWENMSSK